ncbi:MAG TPA: L,D-transpeptidase, partial [Thermoleophilaceae bacterium]|nr:L,D-transpeptidase [Thermoleophilaceae bacterium]
QKREWVEVMAPELANGETGWVRASALDVGRTVYSLRADLSERRIEVRRRGRLVRTLPVAIGGPATPTPTGEFAVTDKLYVSDGTAAYGCCALALTGHQPDVPQEWSGGDRLAVHATPHTATIGQPASLGCFRASEENARWLVENVPIGSPIAIVE